MGELVHVGAASALEAAGIPYSFVQELGGAWTLRLTIPAEQAAQVVGNFLSANS